LTAQVFNEETGALAEFSKSEECTSNANLPPDVVGGSDGGSDCWKGVVGGWFERASGCAI
jgi:hypothetical protein